MVFLWLPEPLFARIFQGCLSRSRFSGGRQAQAFLAKGTRATVAFVWKRLASDSKDYMGSQVLACSCLAGVSDRITSECSAVWQRTTFGMWG